MAPQTNGATNPNSWPGLIWWFITNPATFVVILIIAAVVYTVLRALGYDFLPPLLARLGFTTVRRAVDISGRWKYRCTVQGKPFHQWGGIIAIRQNATVSSSDWNLSGHRMWETEIDESGKSATKPLNPHVYWETKWGVITPDAGVRFAYLIAIDEGQVEGYAYGDIREKNGRPVEIQGRFFQLPPVRPLHGTVEFKRMTNDADVEW